MSSKAHRQSWLSFLQYLMSIRVIPGKLLEGVKSLCYGDAAIPRYTELLQVKAYLMQCPTEHFPEAQLSKLAANLQR